MSEASNVSIVKVLTDIVDSRIFTTEKKTDNVLILEKVNSGTGLTPVNLGQISY